MPRQNRVNPYGEIIACPERGMFTGNRGILVDEHGQMTNRRWTTHAWIACVLEYKGVRRKIMTPGTWTELFFLDEATALAAGHRPCGACRRADFERFKTLWQVGNHQTVTSIKELDRVLHAERVNRKREKVTYTAALDSLPDGTMIELNDAALQIPVGATHASPAPYLIWQDALWRWSPGGYTESRPKPDNLQVTVLTPRSIVNTLAAGYVPVVRV